ncbi:MAG: ankyrin repeat domain-containing protein [Pirellulales bacterium]
MTALMVAVRLGRIAAVKLLLEHGASRTATDDQQRTPADFLSEIDDPLERAAIADLLKA